MDRWALLLVLGVLLLVAAAGVAWGVAAALAVAGVGCIGLAVDAKLPGPGGE